MPLVKYPSISILSLTLNSNLALFKKSLESIRNQEYPQDKIEHLIIDGGSRKDTINLAKKYGCRVIVKKDYSEDSEGRRSFGVTAAKNEIILWLEPDNILPEKNTLLELIRPLIEEPSVISTFTLHYNYNPKMSLLNRYCSLFGVSDPVVIYMNRAEKEPWFNNEYKKGTIIKRAKNYDIVEFDKNTLPTVGDNGSTVWRKILLKAKITPKFYFHTDVFIDLINLGYNRFAVVKSTSIENYIGGNLLNLVKRRSFYMQRDAAPERIKNRRYAIVYLSSPQDIFRLMKFIIFSLTFIQTIYISLKGFSKKKDFAWFLHPLACLFFMIFYTKVYLSICIKKLIFIHIKKAGIIFSAL